MVTLGPLQVPGSIVLLPPPYLRTYVLLGHIHLRSKSSTLFLTYSFLFHTKSNCQGCSPQNPTYLTEAPQPLGSRKTERRDGNVAPDERELSNFTEGCRRPSRKVGPFLPFPFDYGGYDKLPSCFPTNTTRLSLGNRFSIRVSVWTDVPYDLLHQNKVRPVFRSFLNPQND